MKIKSKKPGKQRKNRANLSYHKRNRLYTARLDDSLKEEWGIRKIPLRIDDEVRIIKGELINVEGKVLNLKKNGKIEIEEATLEKKSGAVYYVPISPSNVVLTKFGGKKMDPWRQKIIDRKLKLETELETKSTGRDEEI